MTKSTSFRAVNEVFQFEGWMIEDRGELYGLAAAFELANIKDNECIRISAEQQRRLFGKAVIGKRAVRLHNGRFEVIRTCAFGQDWDVQYLDEII